MNIAGPFFTIMSEENGEPKEIGQVDIFPEHPTDEELMIISGALTQLARFILVELGELQPEADPGESLFNIVNKSKLH